MKRVLVTGGAGFIGSHLVESLLSKQCEVVVLDDESTGSVKNLDAARNSPSLTYIRGDVRDADCVRRAAADVDHVFHLAAAVGVALIARQPVATIERNIEPTRLLLAALVDRHRRGERVKMFLASTSEVYGKNAKSVWTEEDDLVFGPTTCARWSYGASKAIDEFLALGSAREYGLPIVIGRFFNVVGPRQTGAYGMVLPRFVDAALAGEPLVVHDDGRQTRCFAHVHDVVRAILALMQTETAVGRVFNIGSDQPIAILDLAQRVIEAARSESTISYQSYADAFDKDFEDIRRRVPSLQRLRDTIDYRPDYDLDGIIGDVIASRG